MFLNWTCDETINSVFIYLQRDYYNFISSFFKFTPFIKFFVFKEYLIKYIYIYPNWEKLLKNVECR